VPPPRRPLCGEEPLRGRRHSPPEPTQQRCCRTEQHATQFRQLLLAPAPGQPPPPPPRRRLQQATAQAARQQQQPPWLRSRFPRARRPPSRRASRPLLSAIQRRPRRQRRVGGCQAGLCGEAEPFGAALLVLVPAGVPARDSAAPQCTKVARLLMVRSAAPEGVPAAARQFGAWRQQLDWVV